MGAKIRRIVPNFVYEVSIRTVDRCFLFTPNHNPQSPLLDATSPPCSLERNNNIIPKSSILNIIGAAIGKALLTSPIQIHAFEVNSNHIHIVFSVTESQMDNVVSFFRQVFSTIARKVNLHWDREGHVFGGRSRAHSCLDDDVAAQKVLYAMTNPAKDNLIDKTARSPFFTTYHHQAKGAPLKYWYIDFNAYNTAGANRKKSHRLKDYLCWVEWETTPLPAHQAMTPSQRQTWFRKQVRAYDEKFGEKRQQDGHTVLGFEKLKATNPRNKPANPKKSGKSPLCHCSDKSHAKEFRKQWKAFLNQYIPASADYRNGMRDREFPVGSYKPPLFDVSFALAP